MKFETKAYEDWLSKIKKELKTEDLSSFNTTISENIQINPFFGRKPEKTKGNREVKSWKHKIIYQASTIQNSIFLEDLAGGIDYVEIHVNQPDTAWNEVFKDVIFDYIDLVFVLTDRQSTSELKAELAGFDRSFNMVSNKEILQVDAENYIHQLKEGFKQLVDKMDDCEDNDSRMAILNSFRVIRKISAKIIEELAISEAIELLSYNVCKGFGLNPKCVPMHAECLVAFDDVERNYIDVSMKALIAGLANYNAIYIQAASSERTSFHHRISRNVHHLLKEESNLHFSRSAFKGSQQVKLIRDEIAKEVWSFLHR